MESRTYARNLQITPRKLRLAADVARKRTPLNAVTTLQSMNTKSARILAKVIRSAITNAKQTLNAREDMVQFKLLVVEEGQKLRRYRAASRGMVRPFARQFAHAKIILTVPMPEKKSSSADSEKAQTVKKPPAESAKDSKTQKPASKTVSRKKEESSAPKAEKSKEKKESTKKKTESKVTSEKK